MENEKLDQAPTSMATAETLRKCPMCKVEKFASEFYKNPRTGRLRAYCYPCARIRSKAENEKRKEYHAEWYQKQRQAHPEKFLKENRKRNIEKERAYGRDAYWKNRAVRLAYAKEWRLKNPEKQFGNILRTRFKITVEQYRQMHTAQDGLCAVCRKPEDAIFEKDGTPQRLAVDHDHACCSGSRSCGKCIRALLCSSCNSALGLMRDDEARLMLAVEYLRKWKR